MELKKEIKQLKNAEKTIRNIRQQKESVLRNQILNKYTNHKYV